ncbi:MAG: hypothetical protein HC915_05705 [Anaerolineae bacterium]|nr:hypothetical protein [Anaerolineae bacterium]
MSQPEWGPVVAVLPGLELEEWHHGRILIMKISSVSRAVVDAGSAAVLDFHARCQAAGQPVLLAYDVSPRDIAVTPYARQAVLRLTRANPHLSGRVAVILPRSALATSIAAFVVMVRSTGRPKRVFYSAEEARHWLEEGLEAATP